MARPGKTKNRKLAVIQKLKRIERVRQDLLNGITSHDLLATRHGVSRSTIAKYVMDITNKFVQEDEKLREVERSLAVRRMLEVYSTAANDYQRSRQDAVEIQTTYTPVKCSACNGTGFAEGLEWCDVCDGDGKTLVETIKKTVRGQAGDPRFLRVQVDVAKEIHRIQGLGKEAKATQNHFHLHETSVDLSKVSDAKILKALEVIDEMRAEQAPIDVEVKQIEDKTNETKEKS